MGDIVQFVHTSMNKNRRQAYAVNKDAGHQTSAESGALAALSLVFHVCQAAVPTALDKEPSATCAAEVACSTPPRRGVSGTVRSM